MRVNFLQSAVSLYPYKTGKSKVNITTNASVPSVEQPVENPVKVPKFLSFKGVYSQYVPLNIEEKAMILDALQKHKEIGRDFKKGSIGNVYKVTIPTRDYPLAIKEYTYTDENRNPKKEALSLIKIPRDCKRTQRYLGVMKDYDKQYIVTTYQEGQPLSKYKDNMSDEQMANILDELFKLDKSGVVYYDYGMANIVTDGIDVRFFDFEVNKDQSFTKQNHGVEDDLCHQSRNPYFLKLSNIAAFDIRTVGKIIGELEKYPDGDDRSAEFVERYLKQLSKYYQRTAELYEESSKKEGSEMSQKAVDYEKNLAEIFKDPCEEVVNIEKQRMRINELLTEYHYRNDPDLLHDEKLYMVLPKFVQNMRNRFQNIQQDISTLYTSTLDSNVEEYCKVNAEYMSKLEKQYLDDYLDKR